MPPALPISPRSRAAPYSRPWQPNLQAVLGWLMAVLAVLLPVAASAARAPGNPAGNPSREPANFAAALRDSPLGGNPAQAFFLVGLMRQAGAPPAEVDALRRALMHAYLAQLGRPGVPAEPPPAPPVTPGTWQMLKRYFPGTGPEPVRKGTLGAAIAQGHALPPERDASFAADWQAALNQGLVPRWLADDGKQPLYFTSEWRDMRPLAPGLWAAPSANGQLRLMLALRLVNRAALPLPIYKPDIVLDGLAFACEWDRPPLRRPLSEMQANEVTLVASGAESDPLVCQAPLVDARRGALLPGLLAQPSTLRLLSHDLDSAQRLYHLELALGTLAPQAQRDNWYQRLRLARQEQGRQWVAGDKPLDAPVSPRWASSPHESAGATWQRLRDFLAATVLALGLFAGGRGLMRLGVPGGVVGGLTLLAGAGLVVGGAAYLAPSAGGYLSNPAVMGTALWITAVGPVLLVVLALHGLHTLLEREDLSWWDTVATGWRNALDLGSPTSRAEFWGFVAHCAWLWLLARYALRPLDRWVGLLIALPLLTLIWRRLRSLSGRELLEGVVAVVCIVLLALA